MSDDRDNGTERIPVTRETTPGDPTPEGEAKSRRRALVVLVVVVVLALVAALVTWSVVSGADPAPTSTSSASAEPGDTAGTAEPEPEPGASETPGAEPSAGEITDGALGFDDDAPVGPDVSVALSSIEAVDGVAESPGEIAGPSIRFTVTFTNDGDEAYSLAGVVPNVYYGEDLVPAIPLRGPGGQDLPEEVEAGDTATGTFVFNVPEEQRGMVRITVDYDAAEPAVVFEGAGPT